MTDTPWSPRELEQIEQRDELHVAPRRSDGTLAKPRTVWMVRVDDDVYVRSVKGAEGVWYQTTRTSHEGHVTTGSVTRDVAFVDTDHTGGLEDRIDDAYRAKYSRYSSPVAAITAAKARATTLRLAPQ